MKFLLIALLLGSFQAGLGATLDSFKVTFSLSAEDLPRKDLLTQPDALVQIYFYRKTRNENNTEMHQFLGETLYVRDNINPEWKEVFPFTWKRGTGQTWLLNVMDHDLTNANDPIGSAEVSVDNFMESPEKFRVNLTHGGLLTLRQVTPIAFKLSARNLPGRDRYLGSNGLSDPYAILSYRNGDAVGETENMIEFLRTSVLVDNSNPIWPETIIFSKYQPSSGQVVRIQVFDKDLLSRDELLGEAYIRADELTERKVEAIFPLQKSEGDAGIVIGSSPPKRMAPRHSRT